MGLDIYLETLDHAGLPQQEFAYRKEHRLSRAFCHFMFREMSLDAGQESELEQIRRLTGLDLQPLYAMKTYWQPDDSADRLAVATSEQERQEVVVEAATDNQAVIGNIQTVLATVTALIQAVAALPELASQLHSEEDTHGYFADFLHDPGDGYIDNNLGQDLRNLQRFVRYASRQGSTTVFFRLG